MNITASFKTRAVNSLRAGKLLQEAREVEYYIEDKLLSVTMPPESNELSFFLTGGEDEDETTGQEKTRAVRLLFKILKLLQSKGLFGDVNQFWSDASVKRRLASYGILHAPLTQPIKHKTLVQILKSAGLDVISSHQYDKQKEKDFDQQADPEELEKYKQSLDRDNNKSLGVSSAKPDDEQDDDDDTKKKEESLVKESRPRKNYQSNAQRFGSVYNPKSPVDQEISELLDMHDEVKSIDERINDLRSNLTMDNEEFTAWFDSVGEKIHDLAMEQYEMLMAMSKKYNLQLHLEYPNFVGKYR